MVMSSDLRDKLRGIKTEEKKESKIFPETNLLNCCTKIKASSDGKKVELLDNNDEILGTLHKEDDTHQFLNLANGNTVFARYMFSKDAGGIFTWSVYDMNDLGSKRIINDDDRAASLKRLLNDINKASKIAVKYKRETVCFRKREMPVKSRG